MALGNMFTQKDLLSISDAVKDLETTTSGEIVPVIAEASARYLIYVLFYSSILSYILSTLIVYYFSFSIMMFPVIGVLLFCALIILLRLKKIKYLLIPKRHKEIAVFNLAKKTFFEKNLHKTRDKTGILIFVSLFERKVIVIGDEGINAKIGQSDWENVVSVIKASIKSKNVIHGLIVGIGACKDLLAKFFPIKPDDTNELSNELVLIEEEELNLF